MLKQALDGGTHEDGVMDLECQIEMPDGALRWLRLAAEPTLPQGGSAERLVGICLDITEQKKNQEQAMRLHCAGELAAGIGHDLSNLLAIAALCLKRVQARVRPDHPAHPVTADASLAVLAAGRPGNLRHEAGAFGRVAPLPQTVNTSYYLSGLNGLPTDAQGRAGVSHLRPIACQASSI